MTLMKGCSIGNKSSYKLYETFKYKMEIKETLVPFLVKKPCIKQYQIFQYNTWLLYTLYQGEPLILY